MTLLLEVMIGLGIFVTAMLMVFGLFATSQRATVSAKNFTVASDLCRDVMEAELAAGYDGVSNKAPVDIPMPTTVDGVVTTTTYTSQVQVFVEPPDAPPMDFERKRILVTISWVEVTGGQRSTKLETYLAL